jgi:phosphoribosylamine--glycine ligase
MSLNVLIVDAEGLGLDFALRCVESGHSVKWFKPSKKPSKVGQGFRIDMVDDFRPHMSWAKNGLVITTGNAKYITELDRFRDLGWKIFAPTARSAKLEIDRAFGMEEMQKVGIKVPPYEQFKSLKDAENFARKSDKAWCFKTLGSEEDKALSYVASDPADMVGWIQRQQKLGMTLKGPCMLQEKIDMLAEVGVSGWFGPEGFLPEKWSVCFEHKKLMNDEKGPNTGEQGSVLQYVETDKMAEEMLKPMENYLLKAGHRGDFAIGCGIDKSGKAWPFEFTARLGWPAFYIQIASHKGDPAQWMRDLLDGKDTLRVSRDAAIGVVMAQPRYPYNDSDPKMVEGVPISGCDEVWADLHPAEMMMGRGPKMDGDKVVEGPIFQTAGEYVAIMTALGDTVEKAKKRVYRSIRQVSFPNAMYRTDIGKKVIECLPELKKFGYAMDLEP